MKTKLVISHLECNMTEIVICQVMDRHLVLSDMHFDLCFR